MPSNTPAAPAYSPDELLDIVAAMVTRIERDDDGTLRADSLPPIVQLGHPVLRARTPEYAGELPTALLEDLLEVMRATMHAAPGVGLAAPQIGLPLRLAVLEDQFPLDDAVAEVRERVPLEYFAAINPSYAAQGHRTASFYEGCLSFNGYQAVVERPADLLATYTTELGETVQRGFTGWPARIFAHETDHLDGTVYIDKAITRSLCTGAEYAQRWAAPGIDAARTGLGF
ncbi:peptide deformylase [Arthrobacter sp. JSM 101049]|uniref:peptide deformylase n=1 Tax=Arthrobacter sp. JSM 101049 TaxID=929097 RepID=UPI00356A50B7